MALHTVRGLISIRPSPPKKNGTGKTGAIAVKTFVSSGKELQVQSMLSDQGSYKHREEHRTGPFVQTIAVKLQFADGR